MKQNQVWEYFVELDMPKSLSPDEMHPWAPGELEDVIAKPLPTNFDG